MSPVTRTFTCLLAGWLLLTAGGCATLNLSKIDFRSRKASARNPAVKIVCLWEPAEGRDPQGVPCQGFAGQILFLTSSSLPVSVDGDVRIYLFDNQGNVEDQSEPLHKFDFDSGAWSVHYSYGTLGPAYNVFVPYTRHGVHEATCALRIRLTPQNGPTVFSDMTSIELLSFSDGRGKFKVPLTDPRVEETAPEDLTSVNKRRRTTTIVLNAQNGVASDSAAAPPVQPEQGKVVQANYEAEVESDARPLTDADVRIAQLEQMVKELRAMQGTLPPPEKKVTPAKLALPAAPAKSPSVTRASIPATTPSAPPRRLDDEEQGYRRIKVRTVEPEPESQSATPSEPDESMDTSNSTRFKMKSDPRVVTSRTPSHPLEDSTDRSASQVRLQDELRTGRLQDELRTERLQDEPRTGHPLNELRIAHPLDELQVKHPLDDSRVKPVSFTKTAAADRPNKPLHPLDDDQPFERPVTRKTIRATEVELPGEQEQDEVDSTDPFEPIETDTMESTAVQSSPAIRRSLRATVR